MAPPRNIRFATSKDAIGRDLDIARARKEFFPDRPDVSDDRALRRMQQADQLVSFKNQFTKPVQGSSNLLQMTAYAPRTLAQEEMRLAREFGPTFREIGSDIAFGIGSIAKGIGDRIQSGNFGILGIAKDLYNRATGALRSGVDKLSSVDLEILKNKDKYNFVSNKPKLQGIEQLEVDAKLAANIERNAGIIAANRNLFGDYSEFGGPVSMETAEVKELDPIIAPKAEPTKQEVQTIRTPFITTNVGVGAGPTTFDRTIGIIERDPQTLQDTTIESFRNPSPGLQRALAGADFVKQEDQKILDFLRQTKRLYEGGIVSSRR